MAFEIVSPEITDLVKRKFVHDVTIERRLYSHSTARVVIDWDETLLEGHKKPKKHSTANLGAAMLNAPIKLRWRGDDLSAGIDCFSGYVEGVSARHTASRSYIALECVSLSKRSDVLPHYRA